MKRVLYWLMTTTSAAIHDNIVTLWDNEKSTVLINDNYHCCYTRQPSCIMQALWLCQFIAKVFELTHDARHRHNQRSPDLIKINRRGQVYLPPPSPQYLLRTLPSLYSKTNVNFFLITISLYFFLLSILKKIMTFYQIRELT